MMHTLSHHIKRRLYITGMTLMTSISFFNPAMAADTTNDAMLKMLGDSTGGSYLQQIQENTAKILQSVNMLPAYINIASQLTLSWLANDTSQSTIDMQGNFTTIGNAFNQNITNGMGLQPKLTADLLGNTTPSYPFLNDIAYTALLGPYPAKNDPRNKAAGQIVVDPGYNYIKNAAGINIVHPMPPMSGNSSPITRRNYLNYYNAVMAVQSYNGFLLSDLYTDYTSGQTLSNTQKTLMSQATDGKWITSIATENLGIVLRQILMFESQSYVLLMELVKAERQMVAAQAMNNTLLILNMQSTETLLYGQASGKMPNMSG